MGNAFRQNPLDQTQTLYVNQDIKGGGRVEKGFGHLAQGFLLDIGDGSQYLLAGSGTPSL